MMVRLGMTTNSPGRRNDESREYSPSDSGHTFSHTAHHQAQHFPLPRSTRLPHLRSSSNFYEGENFCETNSSQHLPSNPLTNNISPSAHSLLSTYSPGVQSDQPQPSGWSQRTPRPARDVSSAIYQVCQEEGPTPDISLDNKYEREARWCPLCHASMVAGVVHHCTVESQPHTHTYAPQMTSSTSSKISLSISSVQLPVQSQIVEDHSYHDMGEGNTSDRILSRVPSLLPISLDLSHPSIASPEGIRQGILVANPTAVKSRIMSPTQGRHSSNETLVGHKDQEPVLEKASHLERPGAGAWSGGERNVIVECESWETPTSLISRLTAGLTARSSQEQQKMSSHHSCPSPSPSEESDASSFFCQKEEGQAEDPFLMAHQELMDEAVKTDFYPSRDHEQRSRTEQKYVQETGHERSRKYTGSESVSSDQLCLDSSVCGSQESDMEDSRGSSRYPEGNYQPADLKSLLKIIRVPSFSPYTPDKESISDFLEPEDIGHINHMIKSLSDAVLTISLPDTLYKDKGFTPLDYMDIHLNAVIRQFFFVFKNEDFLNLSVSDQIALVNGCSLRAVSCSGLYLFNQDSGCWHIPGATSHLNQPVIHISDLLQVYPQHYVTKMFELHTAAAKLDFDWPIGVITNCILMYTPINKLVQEMDKIDALRNKYVHLLLKYISWKHGHHNAALIFPEILKILDAVVLLVDELSTLTLNLSEDEVLAVEERLSTLTLIQMAPLKCQSDIFKEAMASWSNLDCVNLVDIHNRLCMALQISMLDSFQSNTAEYWAASSMYYPSSLHRDNNLSHHKNIPQLMPASDKHAVKDSSKIVNQNVTKQNCEPSKVSSILGEKDLMLLRRFLEDVAGREGSMLVEKIREKIDANQIQRVIRKLCS